MWLWVCALSYVHMWWLTKLGGVAAMAVCIVEVDSRHTPTIQYGTMCVVPCLHAVFVPY